MFVRTLVSGVRSSCDASATSWRCALVDSSTRSEHRVEARRQAAELVLAVHLDPLGEVLRLRDALDGRRQPADGTESRTRHEQAEDGRGEDPAQRDENQKQADPME